jgi:hypothetical protein
MSTYADLQKEFNAKVAELQKNCKHPKGQISGWISVQWAPGHETGASVKMCKICHKIVEESKAELVE